MLFWIHRVRHYRDETHSHNKIKHRHLDRAPEAAAPFYSAQHPQMNSYILGEVVWRAVALARPTMGKEAAIVGVGVCGERKKKKKKKV